jgi:hypothetical protein
VSAFPTIWVPAGGSTDPGLLSLVVLSRSLERLPIADVALDITRPIKGFFFLPRSVGVAIQPIVNSFTAPELNTDSESDSPANPRVPRLPGSLIKLFHSKKLTIADWGLSIHSTGAALLPI